MLAAVVMSNRMAQERRRLGGFGDVGRAHTFHSQRAHNHPFRRSATSASYLGQQRRRPQAIELQAIPEDYEPYRDPEIDRRI